LEKERLILVFGGGWLYAISSTDGEVVWKKEISSERLAGYNLFSFARQLLQMSFMV